MLFTCCLLQNIFNTFPLAVFIRANSLPAPRTADSSSNPVPVQGRRQLTSQFYQAVPQTS